MQIHLCKNEGFCTADCHLRRICRKQRINFLIHAVVIDYKEESVYADEYLNEIAIVKQNLVDAERKRASEIINEITQGTKEIATQSNTNLISSPWSKFDLIEV